MDFFENLIRDNQGKNFFICGFSGSGKSELLDKIQNSKKAIFKDFDFIDLDNYIWEKHTDRSTGLGDFIKAQGIEKFRELELSSLLSIAAQSKRGNLAQGRVIIALGGGSLNEKTLELLSGNDWLGCWLDTDFELCYSRIKEDKNRPLVANGKDFLYSLYKERCVFYSQFPKFE